MYDRRECETKIVEKIVSAVALPATRIAKTDSLPFKGKSFLFIASSSSARFRSANTINNAKAIVDISGRSFPARSNLSCSGQTHREWK